MLTNAGRRHHARLHRRGDDFAAPEPARAASGLAAEIDAWTQRALAIKKDERFPTVTSLWSALRPIVATAS